MRIVRTQAFARAALVGNPSDGYYGRTLAVVVRRFCARVVLYEWDEVEIILSQEDRCRFGSVDDLAADVRSHGYYGGIRLVKATIKRFADYCRARGLPLAGGNFSLRYESNIPRQVGLAGSSAIVVATLRALMEFHNVAIPREVQPSLALSVETDELGIPAGLQDRVAQVYEGLVSMDFSRDRVVTRDGMECGVYEPLDERRLPPLFIAYARQGGKPTGSTLSPLKARYEAGEARVVQAMQTLAGYAQEAREALVKGDHARFAELIDANFDVRRALYTDGHGRCTLDENHVRMIDAARAAGASANFAGSGGAIVGTYSDAGMLRELERRLGAGCEVFAIGTAA
ncbi:MAG: GHMP kinase [Planctomycetia bacterium]|nr:GHMP kinase [Planctomycetia bacterium]